MKGDSQTAAVREKVLTSLQKTRLYDTKKNPLATCPPDGGIYGNKTDSKGNPTKEKCSPKPMKLMPKRQVEIEALHLDERYAGMVYCFGYTYLFTRKEHMTNSQATFANMWETYYRILEQPEVTWEREREFGRSSKMYSRLTEGQAHYMGASDPWSGIQNPDPQIPEYSTMGGAKSKFFWWDPYYPGVTDPRVKRMVDDNGKPLGPGVDTSAISGIKDDNAKLAADTATQEQKTQEVMAEFMSGGGDNAAADSGSEKKP